MSRAPPASKPIAAGVTRKPARQPARRRWIAPILLAGVGLLGGGAYLAAGSQPALRWALEQARSAGFEVDAVQISGNLLSGVTATDARVNSRLPLICAALTVKPALLACSKAQRNAGWLPAAKYAPPPSRPMLATKSGAIQRRRAFCRAGFRATFAAIGLVACGARDIRSPFYEIRFKKTVRCVKRR